MTDWCLLFFSLPSNKFEQLFSNRQSSTVNNFFCQNLTANFLNWKGCKTTKLIKHTSSHLLWFKRNDYWKVDWKKVGKGKIGSLFWNLNALKKTTNIDAVLSRKWRLRRKNRKKRRGEDMSREVQCTYRMGGPPIGWNCCILSCKHTCPVLNVWHTWSSATYTCNAPPPPPSSFQSSWDSGHCVTCERATTY